MAGLEMIGNRARGGLDETQVGLAMAGEGRGDADQDRVGLFKGRKVDGRPESAFRNGPREDLGRQMADVGPPFGECCHLLRVDVEAHHFEPGAEDRLDEGQAHVS